MFKYYRDTIELMTGYDRSKNDEVYSLMIATIEDRIEKWRHAIKSEREFERVQKVETK